MVRRLEHFETFVLLENLLRMDWHLGKKNLECIEVLTIKKRNETVQPHWSRGGFRCYSSSGSTWCPNRSMCSLKLLVSTIIPFKNHSVLPSWNESFSPLPLSLCLCKTSYQEKAMPFFAFSFSYSCWHLKMNTDTTFLRWHLDFLKLGYMSYYGFHSI